MHRHHALIRTLLAATLLSLTAPAAFAQQGVEITKVCGNAVGSACDVQPASFPAGASYECLISVANTGTSAIRLDVAEDRIHHVLGDAVVAGDPGAFVDPQSCALLNVTGTCEGGANDGQTCATQAFCGYAPCIGGTCSGGANAGQACQQSCPDCGGCCATVLAPGAVIAFTDDSQTVAATDLTFRCNDTAAPCANPGNPCATGTCIGTCVAGTTPTGQGCVAPNTGCVTGTCTFILPDTAVATGAASPNDLPITEVFRAVVPVLASTTTTSTSTSSSTSSSTTTSTSTSSSTSSTTTSTSTTSSSTSSSSSSSTSSTSTSSSTSSSTSTSSTSTSTSTSSTTTSSSTSTSTSSTSTSTSSSTSTTSTSTSTSSSSTSSSSSSTSTSTSSTTSTTVAGLFCGDRDTGPCVITVTRPDGSLVGTFAALQAAVNAAPDGTAATPTRIFVRGRCIGKPAILNNRSNLLIEGEPIPEVVLEPDNPFETNALGRCRRYGPRPDDLRSTLASDHSSPPSGSAGEVVKIVGGTNVRVRFLNIVDGAKNVVITDALLRQRADSSPHDGIEWKNANFGVGFCNCIARNDEGLQLHDGTGHVMQQNLVIANVNGIHARVTTQNSVVTRNRALLNRLVTSDEAEGDGIFLLEGTRMLDVFDNVSCGNRDDGIGSADADASRILRNRIERNGFGYLGAPLAGAGGVELSMSDNNELDDNCINLNADMPPVAVDKVRILSGTGNFGCNVTMPPACDPCTPPASLCTP